jgi:hypothetical protein
MQPTPNNTASTNNNFARYLSTPLAITDTLYYTIDTFKVVEEDTDKTSLGAIRTAIKKEIRATNRQGN